MILHRLFHHWMFAKNDEGETFKEEERELGDWDKVEEKL